MRYRKDTILNLRMDSEPVYALGVHFSYDLEVSEKKNFHEKLVSLKKTLNMWSRRDLSICGKINIVKTLALSKLKTRFYLQRYGNPKRFRQRSRQNHFRLYLESQACQNKKDHSNHAKTYWWPGHEGFFYF